jgi:hypothetical protein
MTDHRRIAVQNQGIDRDAIATCLAGAVDVAALAEVEADMGGFFGGAKEDQIAGLQAVEVRGAAGNRRGEGLLLVGIAGELDALAVECGLH